MSYLQHPYSFSNKAWSVAVHEHRGVVPFDSAGRIPCWYLARLELILLSESDTHPAHHTPEQYRVAIANLEKALAKERQKAETETEAARLKTIADTLEADRWSRRIKRAFKHVVGALRRLVVVVKSQRW